MDKDIRNAIERATQRARKLLEEDFAEQLEGDFDVHRDGRVATKAGAHLSMGKIFQRERIVAAIEHKRAADMNAADSVLDYLRDAAFTTLNRFVALKMLEARELVQECTKGEQSAGYREFYGMAPGLPLLPDSAGYRLYIESLFDELSTEVKVLFDRRDPSSALWPKRATFEQLLEILNATELARVWGEDETIGWVYQFFNGQDERRKMREESQAPRNSRELAVRNQFFTPRYVVQFLADNTLGCIWYEMRGTKTALAEKCEYMVRKSGGEFAPRAKKDPRDLRVLDPACGSGHFLLYAFDLLLAIYEEAHADPESPRSEATGKTLAEDYTSLDALRNAIPGLVLAQNLHGVDIDPRCAQIAQLALWMRAQKTYRDFGVGRAERPQIRRSNVVVAEPLVADDQIAKEFVAKLGDAELGRVFTSLVESLNLAGDLGLLLRVEKLVKAGRKQGELFAPPEERIRAALDRFVREEASTTNTRRRLFADDAAHGVALLSVAEKKFDTVLMNPPFGAGSTRAKKDFEKAYPRTKNDIYAAFVERGIELLSSRGRVGAITSRTGFFLSSFQKWREEILLREAPPVVFADLGLGVMDAALVEAAAYCLEKESTAATLDAFRVLEERDDKQKALVTALRDPGCGQRFRLNLSELRAIPGSPFAYWLKDRLRRLFTEVGAVGTSDRLVKLGASTKNDGRYLRLQWERPQSKSGGADGWRPFAKGGAYSPFYADIHLLVSWANDAREIEVELLQKFPYLGDNADFVLHRRDPHLRPGLTWTRRTKSALSLRVLPEGCVFADKGPAIVHPDGDHRHELLALLAIGTSKAFASLVDVQLSAGEPTGRGGVARSYEVGIIQRTPVPTMSASETASLARLARRAWSLRRTLDTVIETSHAFLLPSLLNDKVAGLGRGDIVRDLENVQGEIDEAAFGLYGIGPEDRTDIVGSGAPAAEAEAYEPDEPDDDGDDDSGDGGTTDDVGVDALSSWLVGVAFGRFDPRLATGERAFPAEPQPFGPLPSRSPGMYPEGEEPAHRPDILVDDEGHPDDLAARALAVAELVKVGVPENLRGWLAKEFFPLHIKTYSKSRRKAPIYWQLATPSASYSVWLYIHAFSKDTFFRVQNDYVVLKLAHEERRLDSMTCAKAPTKQVTAQHAFVEELRAFLDEVKRVVTLWKPSLDDGVIINFSPLWRLVPQSKAWQKELKVIWDALCEGKYDWAHLAMHLWPERVVPKCAKDRSLAIAHGLEAVFWIEGTDGKWTARTPTRTVDELVRERTSSAVKSALKSLLEAPVASGSASRTRSSGRRAAKKTGAGGA
jgi:hypothetical protein